MNKVLFIQIDEYSKSQTRLALIERYIKVLINVSLNLINAFSLNKLILPKLSEASASELLENLEELFS